MKTPVAFIIFNRPEETQRVFEAIRAAQPETLLVVADGPRTEGERARCEATRAIIDSVNWKCVVKKNYSETNLGCGKRVSSGIDWVFREVDRAIIIEDDCLPHPSFFPFCEELLERYKNDEQIMNISGSFFQQKNRRFVVEASYYSSILPHLWGWATWRRAWKKYDYNLTQWPEAKKEQTLVPIFKNPAAYEYWSHVWDQYRNDKTNNWDSQWFFACVANKGICLNPTVNLVSNIGFGEKATHSKTPNDCANIPTHAMTFPLIHPKKNTINNQADAFMFRQNFGIDKKLHHRILRPFKTAFPKLYWTIRQLFGKK